MERDIGAGGWRKVTGCQRWV